MFGLKSLSASALAVLAVMGVSSTARADIYNIYQSGASCSAGLSCNNSGSLIGTVTATQDGANVDILFHITDNTFWFFQAGNPPIVAWNTNPATTASAASLTAMGSIPVSGDTWQNDGSTNTGTPGIFNGSAGFLPKENVIFHDDISLSLVGITLADIVATNKGFFFAVDLCNLGSSTISADGKCDSGKTGFAGAVPLPPAALLFGSALVGLGVLTRRRKKGLAAAA